MATLIPFVHFLASDKIKEDKCSVGAIIIGLNLHERDINYRDIIYAAI